MPIVASVRLKYVPKEFWFDPAGVDVQAGDHVIVETERGTEMGLCVQAGLEVEDSDLKAPLKPVLRVATDEDFARIDAQEDDAKRAMARFRKLIEAHGLDMKPVDVEFLPDGSRATFFYTAEERVDFRSLVRDLASEFHLRVDMRQIGVRDEARALGGLGHCGQELCCARMGGEFMPVSIRMAKEQDLPLNPAKISGLCGRLMCCLRYEFEAYKDFKSRAPKKNALIDTPLGMAKVVEFDTPHETVRVRFEDGKSMYIPVSSMDTGDKVAREGENLRPCHVSPEAFDKIIEELNEDKNLAMMGEKLFSDDPSLADREARAGSVERGGMRRPRKRSSSGSGSGQERSRSQRSRSGRSRRERDAEAQAAPRTERRRRRSVTVGEAGGSGGRSSREHAGEEQRTRRQRSSRPDKPRPGQHSSTVSGDAVHPSSDQRSDSGAPRRRRRRGKRGGRGRGGSQKNAPKADE